MACTTSAGRRFRFPKSAAKYLGNVEARLLLQQPTRGTLSAIRLAGILGDFVPRLFISHSSKDNVQALGFQRWLMADLAGAGGNYGMVPLPSLGLSLIAFASAPGLSSRVDD
jgi:hypothetical protein